MNEFDEVPENDFVEQNNDVPTSNEESYGGGQKVYDWHNAPAYVKAPPRQNLDGKTVTILKADIFEPSESQPWLLTKDGKKKFKNARLILFYDIDGQQESISGMKMFEAKDNKGNIILSHPAVLRDGDNQVSSMFKAYAKFKNKNVNEVSLKEFMFFLNSKPKTIIQTIQVKNPATNEMIQKNLIKEFVL